MSQDVEAEFWSRSGNPLLIAALRGLFSENARFSMVDTARHRPNFCEKLALHRGGLRAAQLAARRCRGARVLADLGRSGSTPDRSLRRHQQSFGHQRDDPAVSTVSATSSKILKSCSRAHRRNAGSDCIPYTVLSKILEHAVPYSSPLAKASARHAGQWLDQYSNRRQNRHFENTVKYHLKNLYDKLEVRNRAMGSRPFTPRSAGRNQE